MSEADFHQLFAEAVAAGRPGSNFPLEISMGIAKVHEKPAKELAWYLNPLSAHMTGNLDSALAEDPHFLESPLDAFGLDSLLAVEIRTWWLKTLQVNIPVMKILSGLTVRDIIISAVEGLLPELTPNISAHEETVVENGHGNEDIMGESQAENVNDSNAAKYVNHLRQRHPVIRSMELSFNQKMYWFGLTSMQDKTALNHTACYRITGKLRIEDLKRAILRLGQLHDTLRMCFQTSTGIQD
ncbi:hypothetical protein HBI56_113570 [Parastagonospora nodorum]|uniref:Carrier domain-containing protein n=2 Tax=Phaeosphaeria nodorum (strain SN15 / ATCC MYA-4574 / FGSC 10173) TaxID=321614 RepID=A0A7U2F876_PHANO|nr:hypothetical protein SNOG_09017 [Parastagonospora nodorum SN15]KAH3952837.1 hypothetical protein HBH53_041220 [Parastagonospora nodorum]EAT83209.1 hypothetical protein SNOG_09017 [Parastagonospora nodorum SN15]KAH3984425.1 hypothetical protein HBH51_031370 [Parastagonospora nodorum]KAH4000684.1 hypothetical protein HBI10_104120 [Parastagonospora nodorum]KAH4052152.1 hypothetical protein HBH49_112630 [Parastagonospora nodorum]